MKKIIRILLISLVLLLAVPVYAKADPPGYKIVKLTNNNIKKYFTVKPCKTYKIGTYGISLYSKLRKKGYFVYDTIGFKAKVSFVEKYKTKTFRHKNIGVDLRGNENGSATEAPTELDGLIVIDDGSYKKSKISNIKFSKVKGKVIFVKPSNVSEVDDVIAGYDYRIKLWNPYDSDTWYDGDYVYDYASDNLSFVINYYYIARNNVWFNDYNFY